ncbi:MAG: DUF2283 domain-containing protein [Candidatus Micrarchaeota archaeon]
MEIVKYDEEADAVYVAVSSKKVYYSLEVGPRIVVDLSESKKVIGVEVIDASKLFSELFGRKVSKSDLKKLDCVLNDREELMLQFGLGRQKQRMILPNAYRSPILNLNS